ncbi:MAG: 6-phosphogluconolactonase [Solirubrobacteraceae bacterium]
MRVEVLPDAEAVAAAAADRLVAARGHVALSGGSTPKRAYALAARRRSDWSGVIFWLGDERHVAPDDERSNLRMAREQLGGEAPIEAVRTELALEDAAADYEERLGAALGPGGRLDLALMGLGPDGHTASLFEGKPALQERVRLAVAVPEAGMGPFVARVTLTLPAFDAARAVLFLVAGEDKAKALRRAFGERPDPAAPSARVRPFDGELLVLADRAAAAAL